jgi:hypothetical protein
VYKRQGRNSARNIEVVLAGRAPVQASSAHWLLAR